MKLLFATATALLLLAPAVSAQDAPAAAPTEPAATALAKFGLDTPIEALVADEKAKAVLEANLPGVTTHPSYEMFKGMSLRQVQPYSEGKLTDELLKTVEAHLAEIK